MWSWRFEDSGGSGFPVVCVIQQTVLWFQRILRGDDEGAIRCMLSGCSVETSQWPGSWRCRLGPFGRWLRALGEQPYAPPGRFARHVPNLGVGSSRGRHQARDSATSRPASRPWLARPPAAAVSAVAMYCSLPFVDALPLALGKRAATASHSSTTTIAANGRDSITLRIRRGYLCFMASPAARLASSHLVGLSC